MYHDDARGLSKQYIASGWFGAGYCDDCWARWLGESNYPQVITLHVRQSPLNDQLHVSCLAVSGNEVLAQSGPRTRQMTIGHVRALLREQLGTELRRSRNGCFYTLQEYIKWYSQGDSAPEFARLRREWKTGKAFQKRLFLVLPSGRLLHNGADVDHLVHLISDIPILAGEGVVYCGAARKASGKLLTEGMQGVVVRSGLDSTHVRFDGGLGTVQCTCGDLKHSGDPLGGDLTADAFAFSDQVHSGRSDSEDDQDDAEAWDNS